MARERHGDVAGRALAVARRAAARRGVRDVLVASGRWCGVGAVIGVVGVAGERVLGLLELVGLGGAAGAGAGVDVFVGLAIAIVPAVSLSGWAGGSRGIVGRR